MGYAAMLVYAACVAIGNVTIAQFFGKGYHPIGVSGMYIPAMSLVSALVLGATMVYYVVTGQSFRMPWFSYEIRAVVVIGVCFYLAEPMLTFALTAGGLTPFQATTFGIATPLLTIVVGLVWKHVLGLESHVPYVPSLQDWVALAMVAGGVIVFCWKPEFTAILQPGETLQALHDKGCQVPKALFEPTPQLVAVDQREGCIE